jgi:hypothetical protein
MCRTILKANNDDPNIDNLVDGFHFYTLNLERSTTRILIDLDAADFIKSCSASPSVLFEHADTESKQQSDDSNLHNNVNGNRKERAGSISELARSNRRLLPWKPSTMENRSKEAVASVECAPLAWAASHNKSQPESSSDEEEDGPAPIGTMAAVKASKRMRQEPLATSIAGIRETEGGREEWMTTPGEHDLLKGILSKSMRSRTFKNEKNRGISGPSPACTNQPINPELLAEVNAIRQAYAESRGPSLLDVHRQQQEELKKQQQGQKAHEWKWSRDKNLDDGRRVDKNALHLVLGGAKTELKSKFQGGNGH